MKRTKLALIVFILLGNLANSQFSIGTLEASKRSPNVALQKVHGQTLKSCNYIELNRSMTQPNFVVSLLEQKFIEIPTAAFGVIQLQKKSSYQSTNGILWAGEISKGPQGHGNIFYKNGMLSGTIYTDQGVVKIDAQNTTESRIVELNPSKDESHICGIASKKQTVSNVVKRSKEENEFEFRRAGNTVVDVMILYPPSIESSMGGAQAMDTEVNYRIAETNQIFANSQIDITFNLVHHEATTIVKTNATSASDVAIAAVDNLRNTYKADIVSHWNDGGSAGSGYNLDGNGDPGDGFNTSNFSDVQSRYTFVHECGHNMGAKHDRQTYYDSSPTSSKLNLTPYYRYGKSFVGYRSIMSYASCGAAGGSDNNCDRVPYFTNPDINVNGAPFGVAGNYQTYSPTGPANNAQRLNDTKDIVANWMIGVTVDYYDLTVVNGSGTGNYTEAFSVTVIADNPPAGKVFDYWSGDISYLASTSSSTTTLTMPNKDITITAVYRDMNKNDEVTVSVKVMDGNDDVEESGDGSGSMYLTSSDLELTEDGSKGNQTIGILFRDVPVPAGMEIKSASIKFIADASGSDVTSLSIVGETDNTPDDFSTLANDVSDRLKTTSSVNWSPSSWTTEGSYSTVDISDLVQEMIDNPLWSVNDKMVFMITGTGGRSAYSYDGDSDKAPELIVSYSLANESPVLHQVTNQTINVNTSLEVLISMMSASDQEGDAVNVVLGSGANYTLNNGIVTPAQGFVGTLYVPIQVTDGNSLSNTLTMEIEVTPITAVQEIQPFHILNDVIYFDSPLLIENVKIVSVSGQTVNNIKLVDGSINLREYQLSSGVYFIRLDVNGSSHIYKTFLGR